YRGPHSAEAGPTAPRPDPSGARGHGAIARAAPGSRGPFHRAGHAGFRGLRAGRLVFARARARSYKRPALAFSSPPRMSPRLLSALVVVLGMAATTALMASHRNFGFSVPAGFVAFLLAALGLLDLFQCFDEDPQRAS